jgi:uncharacterized protein (TIGR03084 family)
VRVSEDNQGEAMTVVLRQATDFLEECEALHATLEAAPGEAWREPTQFKQWTFDDIVGHLLFADHAAALAAQGRDQVQAFFGQMHAARAAGRSMRDHTSEWLGGCRGVDLLERWRAGYRSLAETYAGFEPERRLAWAGPDMSARSFMSARQMETWAHGQAVYDVLGIDREEHDRLRNVAVMGVNTFGWTFTVNDRPVPDVKPHVRLMSPSGVLWTWNDPGSQELIEGTAVDFCRVVTQVRNVADTSLRVTGSVATAWMGIAQCFAGPPEPAPAPGTRFRATR